MAIGRTPGTTPLDGLAAHFDRRFTECPACGYEDEDGRWRARADGLTVEYRHTCPSCGAVERRSVTLDR